MDKTFKILVIVCIILIAGIGVTAGMLIERGFNGKTTQNNSLTNQTVQNVSNSSSIANESQNTENVQNNQNNGLISRSKAMAIANDYASQYGTEASGLNYISLFDGKGLYGGKDGDPYYHVDLKWKSGHSKPYDAGYVEIDAKTGAVNPRG